MSEDKKKLKVLAIHGFMQSSEIFKKRTVVFEKFLAKFFKVEMIYPQGPFKLPPPENAEEGMEFFGWLTMENWEEEFKKSHAKFMGFNKSFNTVILPTLKEHDDIDLIVAFSQGALFATMCLANIIETEQQHLLKNLKGVILASGVGSPQPKENIPFAAKYLEGKTKIKINQLHIFGAEDKFIEKWRSEKMKEWYSEKNQQSYEHDGGHCLPFKSQQRLDYLEFIVKCMDSSFDFQKFNPKVKEGIIEIDSSIEVIGKKSENDSKSEKKEVEEQQQQLEKPQENEGQQGKNQKLEQKEQQQQQPQKIQKQQQQNQEDNTTKNLVIAAVVLGVGSIVAWKLGLFKIFK